MPQEDAPKALHGNRAKVDPAKHVESVYQSYRVTQSHRKEHEVPLVDDDDVAYGRDFVEENKK